VSDGLLAVFFFVVSVELQFELTRGDLRSPRRALQPAIAAAGGVITPIIVYLAFTVGRGPTAGWPVPTATDIAFALGVLALLGRGLPRRVRAFLLALAVLDDLIAIAIIAAFFTRELQPVPLLIAVPLIAAFGWLSARRRPNAATRGALLVLLGVTVWVLVLSSGVHATIAGVALGLVYASRPAGRVRYALEPWVNGAVLPLFALSASMVVVPHIKEGGISPVLWGVLVALPVGKLVGITLGAALARGMMPASERAASLPLREVLVVATLGGVGFTISLLMAELAFRGDAELVASATLGVLGGSVVALVLGGVTTGLVARRARLSSSTR
jgi:NhaA family Na+:H+ antiporter